MDIHLFDDYYLVPTEYKGAFHDFVMEHLTTMYANEYFLNLDAVLSETEKLNQKKLSANLGHPYQLNFFIRHAETKIGWFWGTQVDYETFYMANTAIFKEHRGKGLATAIIRAIVKITEAVGFQKIISKHAATNNNVIIPLLRAGFIITGFELHDGDGIMVQLTYFFNKTRRQVMDFRVGKLKPTPEIEKVLSLKNREI